MSESVGHDVPTVSGEFPLTHWSAVFAAGKEVGAKAMAALTELCGTYWFPLYAFARRKGHQPADAQDLTHLLSPDGQGQKAFRAEKFSFSV